MIKPLTDFEVEVLKRQWEAGVPIKQIVKMMPYKQSRSLNYIWDLQKNGVLQKRRRKNGQSLILDAYNNGMTNPYEISDVYGYKPETVKKYLRFVGVHRNRPPANWKQKEKSDKTKEILECLEKGVKMSEIAKMYGVSRQWVFIVKRRSENGG